MPEGPETDFAASFLVHCCQTTLKDLVLLGVYGDLKKPGVPKKKEKATGSSKTMPKKTQEKKTKKPAFTQSLLDPFMAKEKEKAVIEEPPGPGVVDNDGGANEMSDILDGNVAGSLKSATIVKLRHCTPIFRGTSALSKQKNIWPDAKVVSELEYDDSEEVFVKADLHPLTGLYHQRWYILKFSNNRYFALRPNLHTSINLYTHAIWEEQIVPLPAGGRGFGIGVVFDFGRFVLSFNTKDCLFEILWYKSANPFPSPLCLLYTMTGVVINNDENTLLYAYYAWLGSSIKFCQDHWHSAEPTWMAIKADHSAFDAFGMYATTVVCFLAGLPPWILIREVVQCPSRLARLCEAVYAFLFGSHVKNQIWLKKALSYDNGEGANLDIFHPRLLQWAQLPGHLWHLIVFDSVDIDEKYQDPMSAAFQSRYQYSTAGQQLGCDDAPRKKQRPTYLYKGNGCGIWTMYRMPFSMQKRLGWRTQTGFEKESKLLEVLILSSRQFSEFSFFFSLSVRSSNGRSMDDLNPAPPYYKVLQDMKYKLMGRICDVVNQARKDGTWRTGNWRTRGLIKPNYSIADTRRLA
ncbi:hypothetical protein EV421DRAFT_1737803 [Armillaria borealis]|uniref:Uncharacterized protein n=1 Tax=Armillaria borealis TaxID=47425 RepID=A0AA39JBD4_9AGAR|nr:hypothetical protein EV421DRAFT_1737803 [Armillaria borealis]